MVADKSKLSEPNFNIHECGDSTKITNQLDSSQSSSASDESSKSKSENEASVEDSSPFNDSANDKTIKTCKALNSTYLCYKSEESNESSGDAKVSNVEHSQDFVDTNDEEDDTRSVCKAWKYRNLFSLSSNSIQLSSELCDFKMENLEETKLDDDSKDLCTLVKLKNYLVEYQEMRGTSYEEYTFSTLIRIMGQVTGRCILALFYVVLNIAPILEIFLHILRFAFDKMIDIKNTGDAQQIIVKTTIFFVQLMCIYVCLIFIFGFIVNPVVRMAIGIVAKIMLYD